MIEETTVSRTVPFSKTVDGRARIIAALPARDAEAAEYAVRIHLAEVRDVIKHARSNQYPRARSPGRRPNTQARWA